MRFRKKVIAILLLHIEWKGEHVFIRESKTKRKTQYIFNYNYRDDQKGIIFSTNSISNSVNCSFTRTCVSPLVLAAINNKTNN